MTTLLAVAARLLLNTAVTVATNNPASNADHLVERRIIIIEVSVRLLYYIIDLSARFELHFARPNLISSMTAQKKIGILVVSVESTAKYSQREFQREIRLLPTFTKHMMRTEKRPKFNVFISEKFHIFAKVFACGGAATATELL